MTTPPVPDLAAAVRGLRPASLTPAVRRAFEGLRDTLADDLGAILGGTVARLGTPSGDPACVREVARHLDRSAVAYERTAQATEDTAWGAVAAGHSLLLREAADLLVAIAGVAPADAEA